MNKKRLVRFIALSSALSLSTVTAIALTGCNKNKNKHTHNLTVVEAVDATCTTGGNKEYYVCDGCDLVFLDAGGSQETTLADTVIEKLGHDFENGHHAAETATCTKPGSVEYWECERCELKFSDADGKNQITNIVVTKDHDWGTTGHHAMVFPTTESTGTREYWQCDECHDIFADRYGDTKTTLAALTLDRVHENIDGALGSFYNTQNVLAVGGADVTEGGEGFVINAMRADDGVYLHVTANYNVAAAEQPAGRGKLGIYFNVRNTDHYNLPGGAGVCLSDAMLMELYMDGKIDYHQPYLLLKSDVKTNTAEDAKTKYTNTWEMFIPHSGFATVNNGVFAEAFEEKGGKTVLKSGYSYLINAVGAMSSEDTFTSTAGGSQCQAKDDNSWAFWFNEGHGDWATDQKYYALGATGITEQFTRATDVYAVNVSEYANATIEGLVETVEYDGTISGKATVDSGYRLSGFKVNGKVFKFDKNETDNTYDYSISVADLGLKWNVTDINIDVVVTKLEHTDVAFTLRGNAAGKEVDIPANTAVTLLSEFGDKYDSVVGENGAVEFSNVLCMPYAIKVADYLDGEVVIVKTGNTDKVVIQYRFANAIGDRHDLVDLSEMNGANAAITLGASKVNGTDQYTIGAELALGEDMRTADAYVLETTVTVNDPQADGKWLQRFAVAFAEGDAGNTYNNKFALWWDDMLTNKDPSAIWANDATTCGGGGEKSATYDWLYSSLCDGLRLKVVRNGGYVAVSAFNLDDEQWYTVLEGTTSATAANRIAFYVSGESFTFSGIDYEKLEYVELTLPTETQDGTMGHLIAPNGDVYALNGLITTADALKIAKGSIAFSEYDNVDVDNVGGKITISGNGIADRDRHTCTSATYILPDAVRGQEQISLAFNVKDALESTGGSDWAARRFGIQIGAGAKGLYFWTRNNGELNVIKFVDGTLDMNTDKQGYDIAKANWAAPLIRSDEGLDVRIARIDTKIVVNIKNADGEWVRVGEMECGTSVETEIKFVGGGDKWEVTEIASGKLDFVDGVTPSESNGFVGNVEHYTDGTNYYLADGSVSTLSDVTIKEVNVTLSVTAKELDGTTPVTLADGTQIALKGRYKEYTYTVGTPIGKMLADTYEAYLYGYGKVNVTVGDTGGDVEIALVKTFAYTHRETTLDATNTVKITGAGCPADGTPWSGYAEIVTDKTSGDKSFEFTVKDTNVRNGGLNWAARRIAVQIAGNSGFFFWFNSDSEVCVRKLKAENVGANGSGQGPNFEGDIISTNQGWLKGKVEGDGLKLRVTRIGTKITLNAFNGAEWVRIGETTCAANDSTEFALYAQGDDYEFSNIASKALEHVAAVAPSESNGFVGNVEHYTDGTNYYLADGSVSTLSDVTIKEVNVTLSVTAKELDGTTPVTLADGTQIALKGRYKEYTYTVGTPIGKMLADTYEAYLYGYGKVNVTVGDTGGSVELALVKTFAYTDVSGNNGEIAVDAENKTVTIKGNGTYASWIKTEIVLSDELKGSKNVSLTFTVKDAKESTVQDAWAARRFGVTMQGANGGFMCFTPGSNEAKLYTMGTTPGAETNELVYNDLASLLRSESGAEMRVVRVDGKVSVFVKSGSDWNLIKEYDCDANDDTKITLYGVGDEWVFSNIAVTEYTATAADAA